MKRILLSILILVLAVLFYESYSLYHTNVGLRKTFSALGLKLDKFKKDSFQLQADLEYFKEPENLAKELRGRFNYKKADEKLIIVVPPKDNN